MAYEPRMQKAHTNGDDNHSLVELKISEIFSSIRNEGELSRKNAWIEFYTKRSNRKRLSLISVIALSMDMSDINITAYYLTKFLSSWVSQRQKSKP